MCMHTQTFTLKYIYIPTYRQVYIIFMATVQQVFLRYPSFEEHKDKNMGSSKFGGKKVREATF